MSISDMDVDYFVYDEGEYNENWNKNYRWREICLICSLKMLQTYESDIYWTSAYKNPNITSELIEKHKHQIRFDRLIFSICSMEQLQNYKGKINFFCLSMNKNLTIDLIRKYRDELYWLLISIWCPLNVLQEFEDEIDWIGWYDAASCNENLSIDLIRKHKNDVDFIKIAKWATPEIYEEFKNEFNSYYNI